MIGKPFSLKRLAVVMAGLLLLLLVGHEIFGSGGYLELHRLRQRNEQLLAEREKLKEENNELIGEIKSLKTDPRLIEKIAREELGMVKEGEVKITINKPPSDSESRPKP